MLGLVGDVRSNYLDDDRAIETSGDSDGLVLSARQAAVGNRDPVLAEKRLRLPLRQGIKSLGNRRGHDPAARVGSPLLCRTIICAPYARGAGTALRARRAAALKYMSLLKQNVARPPKRK